VRRTLHGGFELDDDPARVDRAEVHRFLSQESYWALGRPRKLSGRLIDEADRVVGHGLYRKLGFRKPSPKVLERAE
jgi:hypothetical protein